MSLGQELTRPQLYNLEIDIYMSDTEYDPSAGELEKGKVQI